MNASESSKAEGFEDIAIYAVEWLAEEAQGMHNDANTSTIRAMEISAITNALLAIADAIDRLAESRA